MKRVRPAQLLALAALLTLGGVVVVEAQGRGFGFGGAPPRMGLAQRNGAVDRGFTFCRLMYTSVRREAGGSGWNTDYPNGDANFMVRLSQLTRVGVARFNDGTPAHGVVRLTDSDVFECPFLFASDVGTMGLSAEEAERLRAFLLKGGFLWVDDFWGELAWQQWESQIRRVLPEFAIVDIPLEHRMLSSFFRVPEIPQIPSIASWRRLGGGTSERGAESAVPHMRGMFDDTGRLLVLMTHNTDIADGWEREAENVEFFYRFSPAAYGIGVNVALWVLTH